MPLRAVARRSRLLVVEDEPITAEVLYDALSDEHEVLMATSGEPTLALVH
jgi:CheY-like chemotaxis protein